MKGPAALRLSGQLFLHSHAPLCLPGRVPPGFTQLSGNQRKSWGAAGSGMLGTAAPHLLFYAVSFHLPGILPPLADLLLRSLFSFVCFCSFIFLTWSFPR